ncbi:MAG: 16S rRNA (guanine(527)-N(7))-methyltransferase RsmG [Clostridia bacterium]|nr:16S rRNA (guanine(527)-N(7))-methyltransferase RsmG [Clostridia bacterium]
MNEKEIMELLGQAGAAVQEDVAARVKIYLDHLLEYNENVNLTAITDPREAVVKHFADSFLLASEHEFPKGAAVCDVGTGAGFPGAALLCLRPDLKLTLVDSIDKKLEFLRLLLQRLGLDASVVHARAEELGVRQGYRESFDIVTARAVAPLNVLAEYCLPLVRPGGVFLAMKGEPSAGELSDGKRAAPAVGGKVSEIKKYGLDGAKRALVVVEKTGRTPRRFPRTAAAIKKNPLPLN